MSSVNSPPFWYAESTAPHTQQKWFCLDSIYLHGMIEELAGFDLIVSPTCSAAPLGVYPVTIDINGTEHQCVSYVWVTPKTFIRKGLVVLDSDVDAKNYAATQLIKQSVHI